MGLKDRKEIRISYHGEELTIPIVYSKRKSLTIEVKPDVSVVVKAPTGVAFSLIKNFVLSRREWIILKLDAYQKAPKPISFVICEQDKKKYKKDARIKILDYVEYYAAKMEVSYGRIAIREQKTCWGSCSSKRNLNFNWKLILMPPEIMEYVVVHELAHLFEMNHSKQFWGIVEKYLPDYKIRRKWLKENGKRY